MARAKVYSVQPRFIKGQAMTTGWAWVDFLFSTYRKSNLPNYGTYQRDTWLAEVWKQEPILSGIFNAFIERLQTRPWKVTGGRVNTMRAARLLNECEGGAGLSRLSGLAGADFVSTDKGVYLEKGRFRKGSTVGPVLGLQHLDSTRMVLNYTGNAATHKWIYLPEQGDPVPIANENLLRIIPTPSGRDRFRGWGYCAMSRLHDSIEMMLGFLIYYRQKIGQLPPQIIAILQNLNIEQFKQAYNAYKVGRAQDDSDIYPGIFFLGSDDPASPISMETHTFTGLPDSFDWMGFQEWWVKVVSLHVGEASGDYWLLQHTGIGQRGYEVQAQMARGRGSGRFMYEFERLFNNDVLPNGVRFAYDAQDDEQDQLRATILGANLDNVLKMAKAGEERQEFVFTIEEIRRSAIEWGVLDPELAGEEVPTELGAMVKSFIGGPDWVTVTQDYEIYAHRPLLTGKAADSARELWRLLDGYYRPRLVEGEKKAPGPGRGWWGPPKGTHGPGALGGKVPQEAQVQRGSAPDTSQWPANVATQEKLRDYIGWSTAGGNVDIERRRQSAERIGQEIGVKSEPISDANFSWALSSSDENRRSLAIQQDVSAEFGISTGSRLDKKIAWMTLSHEPPERVLATKEQQQQMLRTMYEHTQRDLGKLGYAPNDRILLYRGVRIPNETARNLSRGDTIKVTGNPLSSWSLSHSTAQEFADTYGEKTGAVLQMMVPRNMIFSTARTGFGTTYEEEVVVLGLESEARIGYIGGGYQ